mgnify:CR=1 FL=1
MPTVPEVCFRATKVSTYFMSLFSKSRDSCSLGATVITGKYNEGILCLVYLDKGFLDFTYYMVGLHNKISVGAQATHPFPFRCWNNWRVRRTQGDIKKKWLR